MTNWKAYWSSPAGRTKRMKARAKTGRYTKEKGSSWYKFSEREKKQGRAHNARYPGESERQYDMRLNR